MSNIWLSIVLFLVSGFLYLFFLWKKLHEDYKSNEIFTVGFATILALLVGAIAGKYLISQLQIWFWVALLAYALVFSFLVRRFELLFFETLEAVTPGLLIFLIALFFVNDFRISLLLGAILAGYFWLQQNYKRFNWYRSGKIGFASLAVWGVVFLLRAIGGFLMPSMVSFIGIVDILPSAIVSFLSFFAIYNLNEN